MRNRLDRWPTWALLFVIVVGLLAYGSTRDGGPRSPDERLDAISRRLACPICDGESVYESQNTASAAIRAEIRAQVTSTDATDDEIIAYVVRNYGAETQLVPTATGFESLVWAVPAASLVCAIVGLGIAFRRWRREIDTVPDDADRALVDEQLARFDEGTSDATGP